MLVTESLMNEHQFILKYIDLMERYVLHDDTDVLLTNTSRFIEFIREFADHFHHAKEEDILFRYLVVPGVLTHCNPIPQMLSEHHKGRELVQAMENALSKHHTAELITAISQYAHLLREHIYKEDNILYPMAERGLSDTDKTSLLKDYADVEQSLNSATLWQQHQTAYAELANKLGA